MASRRKPRVPFRQGLCGVVALKSSDLPSRVRVLHFYKTAYPDSLGGAEQFIRHLTLAARRFGVESTVLALSDNPSKASQKIESYTLHQAKKTFEVASMGVSVEAIGMFRSLLREADVVHYHFPWPFADLLHFAVGVRKPSIVTYHSDVVRQRQLLHMYRPLRNWFLSSVNRIVATSPNYLATSPVLRGLKHKVDVIPLGLDQSLYPQPSADKLQQWEDRFGRRFFLFVGVLRYYKGLHILLEACRNRDFTVVIVGAGPTEESLRQKAAEFGMDNVHFLGFLPDADKVALLTLCTAVVFPSHLRSEAFGLTLVEGAMFGKPLISSEIGTGSSFVNAHGETGFVVPASNPQALASAMQSISDQPELASQMGRAAALRYHALFNADKMGADYARLYSKVCVRHISIVAESVQHAL